MHRLLQGEVGASKTVVALRAMAQVVDAGGQAALLAPTEVLAAQHARSISAMLGPLGRAGELGGDPAGTRVLPLTGPPKTAARREGRAAAGGRTGGGGVGPHGQAALLAPTEVLAAQHARSISAMLGPLGRAGELDGDPAGTRVVLLTGSQKTAARREGRAAVADGSAGIVIGTHALLQAGVDFADLGLVVVDEQHRFGVEQRDALRSEEHTSELQSR